MWVRRWYQFSLIVLVAVNIFKAIKKKVFKGMTKITLSVLINLWQYLRQFLIHTIIIILHDRKYVFAIGRFLSGPCN